MTEMVERMARAMYGHRITVLGIYPEGDARFAKAVDEGWYLVAGEAEAALRALMEPTLGMLNAACDIGIAPDPMNWSVTYANGSEATEIWHSMIEVALSEG